MVYKNFPVFPLFPMLENKGPRIWRWHKRKSQRKFHKDIQREKLSLGHMDLSLQSPTKGKCKLSHHLCAPTRLQSCFSNVDTEIRSPSLYLITSWRGAWLPQSVKSLVLAQVMTQSPRMEPCTRLPAQRGARFSLWHCPLSQINK